MTSSRTFQDVLIDDLRADPEQAFAYLQVALEEFDQDGDLRHLMLAVRNVAEARGGVPELARQVGLGKTSLDRTLSEDGNPTLSTIRTVLHGLSYRLALALAEPRAASLRRSFLSADLSSSIRWVWCVNARSFATDL